MPNYNKELRLDTADGKHIENHQEPTVSHFERNYSFDLLSDYPSAEPRSVICPVYNCHGLTFGSRRTLIIDDDSLYNIITQDCYKEIQPHSVIEGDIILYFDPDYAIEHSGIVVARPLRSNHYNPKVVSKWGKGQELLHNANDCPYHTGRIKYYRIDYGHFEPI